MGTYLATGIIQTMIIRKKEIDRKTIPLENIKGSLQKELNLDHYVFGEDENAIFWTIKPELLEGNFVEFLETQFTMYDDAKDMQDVISSVTQAKTGKDIIDLAQDKALVNFQMVDYILDPLEVLRQNGFLDHIMVNYHMIALFIDGKIIMECYDNILHYFERSIRLQQEKYPVVTCLKTMITS